jgi:hypothetical protein
VHVLFKAVFDDKTVFGFGIATDGTKVVVSLLEKLPYPFLGLRLRKVRVNAQDRQQHEK